MKAKAIFILALLCAGCVTTDSTPRQIERQIKLIGSLQKANSALLDLVQENKEKLQQAERDLEALKIQHIEETGTAEPTQ